MANFLKDKKQENRGGKLFLMRAVSEVVRACLCSEINCTR